MRWVVGDVQGCARELDRLIAEIRLDPHRDELWSVGDLINRGPDSLAVLRTWREIGGRAVLGNHEVNALLVRGGERRRGKDTLEELFGSSEGEQLLDPLRNLPVIVRLRSDSGVRDAWIVHAGLRPDWRDLDEVARRLNAGPHDTARLRRPDLSFATRVRCCAADGRMSRDAGPPEDSRPPFRPWDEYYAGDALVVHGHWAMRGLYRGRNTLGLDSGCVYGGKLSAWCQEEDRIVQVPSVSRARS